MEAIALVFDLDGTLIDSAPDIHAGLLEVLSSHNLPEITFAQTRSFIGRGVPALIAQVRDALGLAQNPQEAAQMAAQFTKLYETAVTNTRLYPHVAETLAALKSQGHPLAICTNKPEIPTHAALAHFNLEAYFSAHAFGDGPYTRKPDPAPVNHVLQAIGARTALYIGDSETDAATAQNAGVPFLLFTEGYRRAPVSDLPHAATFDDFRDLPGLVQRVQQAA